MQGEYSPGTFLPARGISAGNNSCPALRLDYSASLDPLPCALPRLAEGQPKSSAQSLLRLQRWHRDLWGCQA